MSYGYRDFSEAALELCGKMIVSNPDSAKASPSSFDSEYRFGITVQIMPLTYVWQIR